MLTHSNPYISGLFLSEALRSSTIHSVYTKCHMINVTITQVFSHGFPYHPTALAYDVLQSLVAVGNDRGTIRIYPLII